MSYKSDLIKNHLGALNKLEKANYQDVPYLMTIIHKTGINLALIEAKFECRICKTPENLQLHHMITRPHKKFFKDIEAYLIQRHYWKNTVILCSRCHANEELRTITDPKAGTISTKRIKEAKKQHETTL